jgi:hypothetical protein
MERVGRRSIPVAVDTRESLSSSGKSFEVLLDFRETLRETLSSIRRGERIIGKSKSSFFRNVLTYGLIKAGL